MLLLVDCSLATLLSDGGEFFCPSFGKLGMERFGSLILVSFSDSELEEEVEELDSCFCGVCGPAFSCFEGSLAKTGFLLSSSESELDSEEELLLLSLMSGLISTFATTTDVFGGDGLIKRRLLGVSTFESSSELLLLLLEEASLLASLGGAWTLSFGSSSSPELELEMDRAFSGAATAGTSLGLSFPLSTSSPDAEVEEEEILAVKATGLKRQQ